MNINKSAFLITLANQTSEALIVLDADLNIFLLNNSAKKIFKCRSDMKVGISFAEFCEQNHIPCFFKAFDFNEYKERASVISTIVFQKKLNWLVQRITDDDEEFYLIKSVGLEQKNNHNEIFQLETLIENMPCNVYWVDKNCKMINCNQNVLNMLQMSREEFQGKTYEALAQIAHWPDGLAQKLKNDDLQIMQSGQPVFGIEDPPIPHANGTFSNFLTSRVPLRNQEGEILGIAGISMDVTDLKEALVKAEIANQAKTEFLANMRHDIRTPLSGIIGFSEILKSEAKDPRMEEYADNLIASSHALLDLMDDVLDAIKVSSGEIPLLKKKFNLAKTLEHITKLYAAKAAEKKLTLSLVIDPEVPNFVLGDRLRVHRVVLELVGNALNFTDSGHVKIEVTSTKKEQYSFILKIIVTDTGVGIPKEKQEDIYMQFTRLTPSYQGIYKGTGLGLFVIKQFIDELNGEIYVESELGKGTSFTCLIPLKVSLLDDASGMDDDVELKIEKSSLASLHHSIPQMSNISSNDTSLTRVLVVEDNVIARLAATIILSSMACQVEVAANAEEALACCRTNSYDLILMDIGLGDGLNGYDVTRYIRGLNDGMKHTPIIALTAHGADENKQRCIESGMNAVLTKPLTKVHAADLLKTFVLARKPLPSPIVNSARRDLPDTDIEMFQIDQFSLLDEEQGIKNSGTKAMLIELLTMMASDLPADLDKMITAFKNKDIPLVEHFAHKIKGGAVYVGTTRLKYACQYLERYWKSGERDLFNDLYHQAIQTIEETRDCVTDWLHKNPQ